MRAIDVSILQRKSGRVENLPAHKSIRKKVKFGWDDPYRATPWHRTVIKVPHELLSCQTRSIWGGSISTKTRRCARAWALHRSPLRASLTCPSLAPLRFRRKPQRRNACRKAGALTPAARSCALPRPTSLRPKGIRKFGSLEVWKFGFREGASPHTPTSLPQARRRWAGESDQWAFSPQSDRR